MPVVSSVQLCNIYSLEGCTHTGTSSIIVLCTYSAWDFPIVIFPTLLCKYTMLYGRNISHYPKHGYVQCVGIYVTSQTERVHYAHLTIYYN